MHRHDLSQWRHDHRFVEVDAGSERRTLWVALLTAVTMVVEIVSGTLSGSMALLADGWHMGTHLAALAIAVFAYRYARRHADNQKYTFGTGKVGVLGGFSSAIILAIVALVVMGESIRRFVSPEDIRFNEAILVAVIGLAVNVVSAVLLAGGSHAGQGAEHSHSDHNLHAAYLHVLADALTSFLAIFALMAGKYMGYVWMDPLSGLVGSLIIARWSYGLLRGTGSILLDGAVGADIRQAVQGAIEADSDNRVSDLHVWKVGDREFAATISIVTDQPRAPQHYKDLLKGQDRLAHITIEVNPCPGSGPAS